MTATRLVFRVDGGPGIGLGHVQRCLSLASAAASCGAQATFVLNGEAAVRDRVLAAGWPVHVVDGPSWSPEDSRQLLAIARDAAARAVVVDSDFDPPEYLDAVRVAGFFACAIEDNANEDVRADLLINGDAHAREQIYRSPLQHTEWLIGPEYALVAPGYAEGARAAAAPPRAALMTLGGSDPRGLTPALLRAIAAAPPALSWEIVIGPFVPIDDGAREALRELEGRAVVAHAPPSLRDHLVRADVVLTAAGQTLYETAVLGRPAVAIPVASNQEAQLRAFARAGAVLGVTAPHQDDVASEAVHLLLDLAADPARLRAMAEAGRRLIDGRGTQRIVERLFRLL